ELQAGRRERLAHDGTDRLDVAPRRQLGYDAAVLRVQVVLGSHDRREHARAVLHHGGGGLVAGALDRQNAGHAAPGAIGSTESTESNRARSEVSYGARAIPRSVTIAVT